MTSPLALGEDTTPAIADILVSGGKRPLRIRLRFIIDGTASAEHFQKSHDRYVRQLFRNLDRNGDGSLDRHEAAKYPEAQMVVPDTGTGSLASTVNFAFNFLALDDNSDGRVEEDELSAYYRDLSDGPFRIDQRRRRNTGQSVPGDSLFRRLDLDGDRRLSLGELSSAPSLLKLDSNANEVLSAEEIRLPAKLDAGKFAARSGVRRTRSLRTASLAAVPPTGRTADVDLTLRFGMRAGKSPSLTVTSQEQPGDSTGFSARLTNEGTVVVRVGDTWIAVRAEPGRLRASCHVRETLSREFETADADNDRIVHEADRLPFFIRQLFPLIDRDNDRTISAADVSYYSRLLLPLESVVQAARVTLTISDEGHGLFHMLDSNQDGRLGLREIRSARRAGLSLDSDGDGSLGADEIPWSFHLLFRRDSLPLPFPGVNDSGAGPLCFDRMDRNGDGDVSKREFLGDRAAFDRLDVDRDGLIGLDEAVQADVRFRKKSAC